METVEERPIINAPVYTAKPNTAEEGTVVAVEPSVCHKPNGVDVKDSQIEGQPVNENDNNDSNSIQKEEISHEPVNDNLTATTDVIEAAKVTDSVPIIERVSIEEGENTANSDTQQQEHIAEVSEVVTEVTLDVMDNESAEVICEEVVTDSTVEVTNFETSTNDVKFKTEILVEKNDSDVNEIVASCEQNPSSNILTELDHNIELSEVLQSDVTDDNANNSGPIRHEVFNKEELLDILEGNDNDHSTPNEKEITDQEGKHNLEAEIALKQLSRLARTRVKLTPRNKKGDKKPVSVKKPTVMESNTGKKSDREGARQQNTDKTGSLPKQPENDKAPEAENIVSALVMDWDDDEPVDIKDNTLNETTKEEKTIEQLSEQNDVTNVEECINEVVLDFTNTTVTTTIITTEENSESLKKNDEEGPPRRISRVIKKKVIFDPDNPDTFTKGKTPLKTKEDHSLSKKPKFVEEVRQRSKSKSPMSKLQWKKPSPKNSKQNKRLSEVDKLLMDEGAVNMLYQLTPDAPKGKKNMRTKAEIIKKLQSSTPETKEMKFRERKKELIKCEDGEAKRVLGGKHRILLSSSVKSPQVSEDFETHSADDSIIYRRHSSSSYSSSCMSPRRLSDVETGTMQNVILTNQQTRETAETNFPTKDISDAFMADSEDSLGTEMINKSDCLSIKEKLNSKLSQVLNKRKRDSNKIDRPIKQKRVSKADSESCNESADQFKFVSIVIENQLAVVRIKKTSVKIGVEVIRELEEALLYLDKAKNISITLLSSECLVLCSSLDLNIILEDNKETRVKQAFKLADSLRLLLCSAAQHSKLLCCSVWGACSGVGLALAALSDVVLASECATFALAMGSAPLFPGVAVLTARCQSLPQALINDLVIFGRRVSSSEALQSGLISRTLWPDRFEEQVTNIVKDIASQPAHTILLKKKLLNLKKNSEEATLLSCLEAERDLLVEYWTSVEGQELLRATLHCA